MISSPRAKRSTTASTSTPTTCVPAHTAVFSIRKGARSVACVEIGLHDEEVTMPTIVQLRAARNRRAPPEVWQATFAWLGGQRLEPLLPGRHAPKPMKRVAARRKLWDPYLAFLADTRHEAPFQELLEDGGRRLKRERRLHGRVSAELPLRLRAAARRAAARLAEGGES